MSEQYTHQVVPDQMSLRREFLMRCSARRIVLTVIFIVGARLVWVTMFSSSENSHVPGHNIHDETDPGFFARFFGTQSHAEVDENGAGLVARNGSFFLDGRAIRIISGSFHYFRTHPAQWNDRLERMKAAGLNTITTYVPWNLHEPQRGLYNFTADGWDLAQFIELVHKTGLHMIIRPGPFICAEWEFGGLPSWLLHDPGMVFRTSKYSPYLKHVERYFSKLFPLLANYTHRNGGPIIAFQIENEYGSYRMSPDNIYMRFLAELYRTHGIKELLFTSDGDRLLARGSLQDYLATVNFKDQADAKLDALQKFQPDKPLMVTEFWPGWFDHWSESHHVMTVDEFNEEIDVVLSRKASINFYMFTGGTNFGFWNGANLKPQYMPTVTSYDYDALVSECGDVHPTKFVALRKLLVKHGLVEEADLVPVPPDHAKRAYGVVKIEQMITLDGLRQLVPQPMTLQEPIFMEFLSANRNGGQGYGWILYRGNFKGSSTLKIDGRLHDRALIFVNGKYQKTIYNLEIKEISETVEIGVDHRDDDRNVLEILVENMGRVNYGDVLDSQRKGFQGTVSSGSEYINEWEHIPLEFSTDFLRRVNSSSFWAAPVSNQQMTPTLYRGWLTIDGGAPEDTFLDMSSWKKGIALVNGFNLGRYWSVGPQQTLYIPAPLLRNGTNEVLVFELEKAASELKFVDKPILG